MIDLDRPPVSDRDLPDPVTLRRATLIAADRATRPPALRIAPFVLAAIAAVLVLAALVGVLLNVRPTPEVAAPPSTAAPLPPAIETDVGPASAAQVRSATRRCVSYHRWKEAVETLFARRVIDGTGETTALVLRLADGRTVHCREAGIQVLSGTLIDLTPTRQQPAAVVGGVDTRVGERTDRTATEWTAAVLRVSTDVARVEVVAAGPDWPDHHFEATPYDGWVYVPVAVSRQLQTVTPSHGATAEVGSGPIPVDRVAKPTLVVTAYDGQGRRLFVQDY